MKSKLVNFDREGFRRGLSIIIGVLVNVLLFFATYKLGLPLYFDTIGTIAVSALAGILPGIVTALATNLFSALFYADTFYFAIVNVAVAVITAWYIRKYTYNIVKKIKPLVLLVLSLGVVCGITSALIQWALNGTPQYELVAEAVSRVSNSTGAPQLLVFVLINVVINIVDKAISVAIALTLVYFTPSIVKEQLKNGAWKQKPLSIEEQRRLRKWGKQKYKHSVGTRVSIMLLLLSVSLVIIIGAISLRLYYSQAKEKKTENAINTAKVAATLIDPNKVDDYLNFGENTPGYQDLKKTLSTIRDSASEIQYLYVVKIKEDGCHFIFDLDTDEVEAYPPGYVEEFEEAFLPYVDELVAGEEIEPIESNDTFGWVQSVYYPVRDDRGRTVCYVGVDVSLSYVAGYIGTFTLRVLLIAAGFFILILAVGLWMTGIYTTYPINSIASTLDNFSDMESSQAVLDENVKKIRSLDIRTDDEIEHLYKSICDLTLNMSEQMRSIRYYSETNEKMQNGLIITMADMVENRDSDTGAHIQKTSAYVEIIARGLKAKGYYSEKITDKYISDVVMSAPLHDVGKINISDKVLNKPGKLTDEEFEIMKTHTTAGKEIIEKAIDTVKGENYLKEARNMAAYHHERWDGKGYPEGLHGEVIPLSARIMAVADVFDALASPRVYKPAFPLEKALSIINEGAGTQFDPLCVEVFMDNLDEVKLVLKKYQDA